MKKKKGGGVSWGSAVGREKIPCVSPSMGEMKCEVREWERRGERWRMEIMGNDHNTAIDRTERDIIQYLRLWQSHVHDVRLASRFAVLKPGEDDLVSSDLAVLLHLQGGLPGDSDGGGVDGFNLQLPGGCSWHWKPQKKRVERGREGRM